MTTEPIFIYRVWDNIGNDWWTRRVSKGIFQNVWESERSATIAASYEVVDFNIIKCVVKPLKNGE